MRLAEVRWFLAHRPSAALAVLSPIMVAILTAVLAYSVPPTVASIIAVVLSIPVAIAGWIVGYQARAEQIRKADVVAVAASVQLEPRRNIALVDRDSLLYANWYFMLRLKEEVERASRYGQKLALLVLQPAPSLGQTDQWGLTSALRESLRSSDVAGHLDRDRIAVILPTAGIRRSTQAKRRLQPLIAPLGYDVGCATVPRDAADHDELVKFAIADCSSEGAAKRAA